MGRPWIMTGMIKGAASKLSQFSTTLTPCDLEYGRRQRFVGAGNSGKYRSSNLWTPYPYVQKPKAVKLCAKQGFDTWPFPAKRAVDIGAITIGWLGFMTISSLIICRIWLTQSGSFSRPEDVAILSSYFCSTNRPLLYVLRCREYREAKSMKSWNAYALK